MEAPLVFTLAIKECFRVLIGEQVMVKRSKNGWQHIITDVSHQDDSCYLA